MQNEATDHSQHAPRTIDQIGSFTLGQRAHNQVRTALAIAKLMRRDGDGEVEDVTRACRMMVTANLFDDDDVWTEVEAESDEDLIRQIDDYIYVVELLNRTLFGQGCQTT